MKIPTMSVSKTVDTNVIMRFEKRSVRARRAVVVDDAARRSPKPSNLSQRPRAAKLTPQQDEGEQSQVSVIHRRRSQQEEVVDR